MRLLDRQSYEYESQKREDCRLQKSDKDFKNHKRHRHDERNEESYDHDKHVTREDIPEETERKRDQAGYVADELQETHNEAHDRRKINELRAVFQEAKCEYAWNLNGEKSYCRQSECGIEISINWTQERCEMPIVFQTDTLHSRNKGNHIGREDEEENGRN